MEQMYFVIEKDAVVPSETPLPNGVSPSIVKVWDRVQTIGKLMPASVVVPSRQTRLEKIRDTINIVAAGGDPDEARASLDEVENDILAEQSKIRRKVICWTKNELLYTLGVSSLTLLVYYCLRRTGFGAISYNQNMVQNLVGAVGWASLGFCGGLAVRRIYEFQTIPFRDIVEHASQKTPAWLMTIGNIAILLALFFSIYFGVSFLVTGMLSWTYIEVPSSSILPGILLGLTAPRVVKAALG